jgi:hypothetical protein
MTDPKNDPAAIAARSLPRVRSASIALMSALLCVMALAIALPAAAEGLQHGLWKVTSAPTINGAPGAPQVKMRCVTPEEAADVDKTFSPEVRSANACERVEHEMSGTRLKWRLQCTGQPAMEVAGAFEFDTPQHYTALVTTNVAIGGQSMSSRVTIEGERTGECP